MNTTTASALRLRVPPPKISQAKAYQLWRVLVEIAYGDLDTGPTPQHVRDHAKEAVSDI